MKQAHLPVAVEQIAFVIRSIAKSAIDNEKYFGELDAVVGDGDLAESLARGFEAILPLSTDSTVVLAVRKGVLQPPGALRSAADDDRFGRA